MESASASNNENENKNIISAEISKQICQHMNDDHASTVYAMGLSSIPVSKRRTTNLENVKMKSVTMTEYVISFVICNGDLCMPKNVTISFYPALSSPSEIRSRLVQEHQKYLTPDLSMLILDPLCLIILLTCILLGYGTIFMGIENMTTYFENYSIISTIFGSSLSLAYYVQYAFYFAFVAHELEAMYVFYLCFSVLKLNLYSSVEWFYMVCCVGYPVTKLVLSLVEKGKKKKQV